QAHEAAARHGGAGGGQRRDPRRTRVAVGRRRAGSRGERAAQGGHASRAPDARSPSGTLLRGARVEVRRRPVRAGDLGAPRPDPEGRGVDPDAGPRGLPGSVLDPERRARVLEVAAPGELVSDSPFGPPERDESASQEDSLGALLRATGRREEVPPALGARVRGAVHAHWRAEVDRRARRRRLWPALALATAAIVLVAVGIGRWGLPWPAPRDTDAARVEIVVRAAHVSPAED